MGDCCNPCCNGNSGFGGLFGGGCGIWIIIAIIIIICICGEGNNNCC